MGAAGPSGHGAGRAGASVKTGHGRHNGRVVLDSFDVAIADLNEDRRPRRTVRSGQLTEALVADVDSRVPAGAEAVAEVVLEPFDGGVAVHGTVSSHWEGECRRCLVDVGGELQVEVRELFRRGGGDEEGTYPMGEEHINLRDMVLDNLFAALPLMPLCREDCAGICPLCGTNRNTEACDCAEVVVDPRWSGLEVLRGQVEPVSADREPPPRV